MKQDSQRKIPTNFYSSIVKIDATEGRAGFIQKPVFKAKEYVQETFPNLDNQVYLLGQQDKKIQDQLLDSVCTSESYSSKDYVMNILSNSNEGICLRCYVSHFILQACQERFMRFSLRGQRFQLRDLLSLVLSDDERYLHSSQNRECFIPYSFEILQEYLRCKPSSRKGLDRWTLMKTKQNDAIEQFLLELGVCIDSDWGILNSTTPARLKKIFGDFHQFSATPIQHLSESEIQRARAILLSFHLIYRGDRRQNRQYERCQPPTESQLQRMIEDLWTTHQIRVTPHRLMHEIKAIASRLRDYRLSCHNSTFKCQSLDALNPETGKDAYENIPDPRTINDLEQENYQQKEFCRDELQSLLSKELIQCLDQAIDQGFCDVIKSLSRRCEHLAKYIKPAFQLLYCEGMSQADTASRLHITQSQVSRHIKPLATKLFQQVKQRLHEELLQRILNKVKSLNVVENSEQLDYFDNLVNQLQMFLETKIFSKMDESISNSRSRQINNLYLQRLNLYLTQYKDIVS